MASPIMIDAAGNELLEFRTGAEGSLELLEADIPLTLALVVARYNGKTLLVLNRSRKEWELPGGMVEPGETPREAAVREFVEETGQTVPVISFVGAAKFRLMPDRRLEYSAVYVCGLVGRIPFVPNDEIADVRWWDGTEISALAALDAEICRLVQCGEHCQPPQSAPR
ncbi:NUDIX hydrolase [Micromonospora sp. NPDC049101]|uniref:NUDIX hydrolase n=1 Tax=unclassified Micromonospora TaxID=2617518 RepID=UPI0033EF98FD